MTDAPRRNETTEATLRGLLIGLLMLTVLPRWAVAKDVVRPLTFGYINDTYELVLMHEALERTRPDYGDYEMQPYTDEKLSLARAIKLAIEGRLVNLLSAGVGQPDPEREMIPVPFPLDKGLLGYRVALIDRHSQDRLSHIHSIEDLRRLRVGQGIGWGDVPIYEHEGIQVETTTDYALLTTMLLHGRFDLYPRGLYEIAPEMAARGERYPDLAVEQHLLLHYPFCEAFYVSRSAPRLAARLTAGLERMVADGSFDALFARHFGKLLANLNLRQRVVIELENPSLPAWVPLKRKELWFDPARLP
jgi:ABC-type amino acid transport substrate-binding protein